MTRLHGRCAVGQRLVAKVPHGHWKTLTFVAGLRCDGIIAPCVFDQPINSVSFLAWVTEFLVPTLRCGDVVVMDNLSSHKAAAVRRVIRSVGACQFPLKWSCLTLCEMLAFLPHRDCGSNRDEQIPGCQAACRNPSH
jgi:hypothetical protein